MRYLAVVLLAIGTLFAQTTPAAKPIDEFSSHLFDHDAKRFGFSSVALCPLW